jgi:membrane associated rhomboid family serine protease
MSDRETSPDALTRLLSRARDASTGAELTDAYVDFGKSVVVQFSQIEAPVTRYIIWVALTVFAVLSSFYIQIQDNWMLGVLTVLTDLNALRGLNAYFFINYHWLAWPLTEFLHRGIGHVAANVFGLAILGKIVEPLIKKRYYLLWFVGVAVIATPIHAYVELVTSTEELVAVYGMSDFVYSLRFFSTIYLIRQESRTELEYLAILVGLTGIVQIVIQLLQGLWILSIEPVNIGHLVGGLTGIIVYRYIA